MSERLIVDAINGWLSGLFDPTHIDETVNAMVDAAQPDDHDLAAHETARARLAAANERIDKIRALMEEGADPAIVAEWTREAAEEKRAAQDALDNNSRFAITRSADDVRAAAADLRNKLDHLGGAVLDQADPARLRDLYQALGLEVTWRPGTREVTVEAPSPASEEVQEGGYRRVGGGI